MNRINLWTKEGKKINLSPYGLVGLSLIPESPSYSYDYEVVDGRGGLIRMGKRLNPREVTARFLIRSSSYSDSLVKRDQIYQLLSGYDSFFIGEEMLDGKRWLVDNNDSWMPLVLNNHNSEVSITFLATKGVAESVNEVERTHTSNFTFNNKGDVAIDPREHPNTEFIFKGVSNKLKITNTTTNEVWTYDKNTNAGDTVSLRGVRSTKNGLSIFRETNKRILSIAKGVNKFEIKGASNYKLTIKTLFYFL